MRKNSGRLIYNETLVPSEDQNTVQQPHVKELASDAVEPLQGLRKCRGSEDGEGKKKGS